LSKSLQMIQSCCFCNESFSASIIHQILLSINTLSSNDTKQALYLLNSIIVRKNEIYYNIIVGFIYFICVSVKLIEDPLQLKRLQLTLDGYKDENTVYNGLLTIVRQNQSSDAKKSYHCVKFIVTLANQ
jgi:ubiquitin carboxyl-terminal hydrolase 9/24